jgi:PKD repeat protein
MTRRGILLVVVVVAALTVVVGAGTAAGQSAGAVEFSETYGAPGYDGTLVNTSDGGYIFVGDTGRGTANESRDAWLTKINSQGDVEFNKTYGGTRQEYGSYAYENPDGGYTIYGSASSSDSSDILLIKTDPNGNIELNKTYGGPGYDYGGISPVEEGGFILTGSKDSVDGRKGWFAKLDSGGNIEFNKTYDRSDHDSISTSFRTLDGGYVLIGFTGSSRFERDWWFIKTDSEGNELFNKTIQKKNGTSTYGFRQTPDGDFVISNGFSTGDDPLGSPPHTTYRKVDSEGNVELNKTVDGYAIPDIKTQDGGYAFGGYTNSSSQGNNVDAWLLKVDSNLNEEFNTTYGGSGRDTALDIIRSTDGGYFLAGQTHSFSQQGSDGWLIKAEPDGDEVFNRTFDGGEQGSMSNIIPTPDGGMAIEGDFDTGSADKPWIVKLAPNDGGNIPPSAEFILSPSDPESGEVVTFDASSSSDPDGSIQSYAWEFGDGTTETGVSPSHSYAENGTYTITVTVEDNEGETDTATETVTVGELDNPFTEPLPGSNDPPINTGELDPNLIEDVDGDGDGLDPAQSVNWWSQLVQNPQEFDDLTQEQVDAVDWNGDGELSPADAVQLWSAQVQAGS